MANGDPQGRDALHYAAADDDVATVRARLDAGVDIDLADRRAALTPLFFAIEGGARRAAELLLQRGANIEARSEPRRMTPLVYATLYWRKSPDGAVIRLLLDRGADRSAGDKNGKTAHWIAQGMADMPPELVELLTPDE